LFVEKPFVETNLNMREKNEKFFKRALLVTLVKKSAQAQRFQRLGKRTIPATKTTESTETLVENKRELQKLNVDYNLDQQLDSFGCASATTESYAAKNLNSLYLFNHTEPKTTTATTITKSESNKVDTTAKANLLDAKKPSCYSDESEESYSADESGNLLIVDAETDKFNSSLPLKITSVLTNKLPINDGDHRNFSSSSSSDDENQPLASIASKLKNKKIKKQIGIVDACHDQVPSSPTPMDIDKQTFDFKPKVIPLEKKAESLKEPAITLAPKLAENKVISEEKPSLFDMISKMQEKLISHPLQSAMQTTHTHANINIHKASSPLENSKDFAHIDNKHDNVSYSIWTFNLNKPIRILVRSCTDGYINSETSSQNSVVLHPKLEYQPQFGCETLTLKDYAKMWAKSYLRNFCDVILCRINVFTSKLISISKLKHDNILPQVCAFNPNQSLIQMKALFERLLSFEQGNYLLTKELSEQKLCVFKSTPQLKSAAFDLHFFYNNGDSFVSDEGEKRQKPHAWIPIDTECNLPYQVSLCRVPCVFEPVYDRSFHQNANNSPHYAKKKTPVKARRNKKKKPT
jgi:hypothetical protein